MTLYTVDSAHTLDLPPALPPTNLWGATEPGDDPRTVITLQVAMTRDMLAVAFDLVGGSHDDEHPDAWTVEDIREAVEAGLASHSWTLLQDYARDFPDLLDDPSIREQIQAEYRAVDRAYPLYAPKES
ncbi:MULTISPECIES: hypothetical protein [Streptomyces]|uniref:Uncharacterized protein n=1 Tax=Streptomyces venezuelae (strain ATCC 10712 / CBS 650.69 / DSM 40230 / JCM 4526 / NBRC 13096 / PD 04745) TaxID=953739 RepID=F2RFX3_STRVP|nr:hypothetical protein [Streptomyces venezuelae]APE23007.1 hypothetical protein vnz_19705 [Streptomyces venezuelae]QES00388.1 hypothetical protein DEJ43_19980 [Streptomyces venezuelae ATCC 10712]CCA57275.1 hypothetical protein SVEN_3989 [Streptomyces venezuelae ATCC 10712]